MAQSRIFEGTAREIADQLRRSNLPGKLRAIITANDPENSASSDTGEMRDKALASLLQEAETIERTTPVPHTGPHEIAFGEILTAKYRKMGLKLWRFAMPDP